MDIDGPIFLFLERADFALALNHHPKGDRLHPARGQPGADTLPQERRDAVADQSIEHAARLLRVHQLHVDLARLAERLEDGVPSDLRERHAFRDLGRDPE